MKIVVIGMGKIGLPLATQYAWKGHDVIGVDVNPAVVATINKGREPFSGEADLPERLSEVVADGRLRATSDYGDAVPGAETIVVAVPLLVDNDGNPDYAIADSATHSIARHLTAGTLVCFETTLPVGTTRNRLAPILAEESGLTLGHDHFVAFSPERVFTGRVFDDLRRYPKIVGGLDEPSTKKAIDFYKLVLDFDERNDLPRQNGVWDVGTAEAAELTKLAETTYRDVNIALANHFAKFAAANCLDIYRVIEAANSQPYSHVHQPGIAVGGHCIPVYPRLYLSNDPDAAVVRAARATNSAMPAYAVSQLVMAYGDIVGARVAVLGAAYRGEVKETAFSGVFDTVKALRSTGAVPLVHDPLYNDRELKALGLEPFHFGECADAAIVQADHHQYRTLRRSDIVGLRVIFDGRRIIQHDLPGTRILTLGSASIGSIDPKGLDTPGSGNP